MRAQATVAYAEAAKEHRTMRSQAAVHARAAVKHARITLTLAVCPFAVCHRHEDGRSESEKYSNLERGLNGDLAPTFAKRCDIRFRETT